jgi:3-mercaptopyruvate sulfurtransferase SseA
VLEWRFDPASSSRLPVATDHDLQVIVFCSEGYASSLAAAVLQDLGLWRATDMVGGFHAWRATGLPIVPPSKASSDDPANERSAQLLGFVGRAADTNSPADVLKSELTESS